MEHHRKLPTASTSFTLTSFFHVKRKLKTLWFGHNESPCVWYIRSELTRLRYVYKAHTQNTEMDPTNLDITAIAWLKNITLPPKKHHITKIYVKCVQCVQNKYLNLFYTFLKFTYCFFITIVFLSNESHWTIIEWSPWVGFCLTHRGIDATLDFYIVKLKITHIHKHMTLEVKIIVERKGINRSGAVIECNIKIDIMYM